MFSNLRQRTSMYWNISGAFQPSLRVGQVFCSEVAGHFSDHLCFKTKYIKVENMLLLFVYLKPLILYTLILYGDIFTTGTLYALNENIYKSRGRSQIFRNCKQISSSFKVHIKCNKIMALEINVRTCLQCGNVATPLKVARMLPNWQ